MKNTPFFLTVHIRKFVEALRDKKKGSIIEDKLLPKIPKKMHFIGQQLLSYRRDLSKVWRNLDLDRKHIKE